MADLPEPVWRKSTFCGTSSCVEVAFLEDKVALRDSKNLDSRPLLFSHGEWAEFINGARSGEFDVHP